MKYSDTSQLLFTQILKKRSPHSFIFYGLNISKIEEMVKKLGLKILDSKSMNSIDMLEFRTDKKSISVDDIRGINQEILKKPEVSKNKVVIIYDSNKMTIEAQNSFLKSLEDVLDNTYIFLIARNIDNIVNTILSRCLILKFGKIDYEEYKEHFIKLNLEESYINDLYIQSKGDLSISKSIIEESSVFKIYKYVLNVINCFIKKDLIGISDLESQSSVYKDNIEIYIDIFVSFIRDILIYNKFQDEKLICNKIFLNEIIKFKEENLGLNIEFILKQLDIFKNRVKSNLNIEVCNRIFILNVFNNLLYVN